MHKYVPLVSVIAINWNTTEITCEFLRSIVDNGTFPNMEVIIVDNGSNHDPTNALRAVLPCVKVILTGENLGFSGGNNVGMRQAKGDYFFIVNNDTEFTPYLIEGLLEVFEHHADVGMVSPKFHYFFNKGIIEYAGYQSVNVFTGRNAMIGCREKDCGQYNKIIPTNYVHGGAMLVSRKVIEQVGMMPELFFLYYEEFDWSEQIKRNGFKIYFQPNSLIYHKESMTTGKSSPLKTFYLTRNRILFMRRNMSLLNYLIFLSYFTCITIPKNTLTFIIRGQRSHLHSFWKGIMWHFDPRITFN
ncbi:glycosyltransferase family 2 protein [Flavitalea antarctica]